MQEDSSESTINFFLVLPIEIWFRIFSHLPLSSNLREPATLLSVDKTMLEVIEAYYVYKQVINLHWDNWDTSQFNSSTLSMTKSIKDAVSGATETKKQFIRKTLRQEIIPAIQGHNPIEISDNFPFELAPFSNSCNNLIKETHNDEYYHNFANQLINILALAVSIGGMDKKQTSAQLSVANRSILSNEEDYVRPNSRCCLGDNSRSESYYVKRSLKWLGISTCSATISILLSTMYPIVYYTDGVNSALHQWRERYDNIDKRAEFVALAKYFYNKNYKSGRTEGDCLLSVDDNNGLRLTNEDRYSYLRTREFPKDLSMVDTAYIFLNLTTAFSIVSCLGIHTNLSWKYHFKRKVVTSLCLLGLSALATTLPYLASNHTSWISGDVGFFLCQNARPLFLPNITQLPDYPVNDFFRTIVDFLPPLVAGSLGTALMLFANESFFRWLKNHMYPRQLSSDVRALLEGDEPEEVELLVGDEGESNGDDVSCPSGWLSRCLSTLWCCLPTGGPEVPQEEEIGLLVGEDEYEMDELSEFSA